MRRKFAPYREYALMATITLGLPALASLWLLIRDGKEADLGGIWILWIFCIVMCLISAVTSFCVLEIDEATLTLRYPFRPLLGTYSYSLAAIESVSLAEYSLAAKENYITINFRSGPELDTFLGSKRSIRHHQMFLRKSRREIVEAFNSLGIEAFE
jgi:hypothetical protein